jgi:hypothetical protein
MSKGERGMETVTSILLLLVSVLLIFTIFSYLDMDGTNETIQELRMDQVVSLGDSLVRYSNSTHEMPFLQIHSQILVGSVFYWNGRSMYAGPDVNGSIVDWIEEVLKTTPDGLSSMVIFGNNDVDINGEYVVWSQLSVSSIEVKVILSVHSGSINVEELIA